MPETDVWGYLLNIGELLDAGRGERLCAEAAQRLDETRRGKAMRCARGRARAASLGAGLLLQLAVQDGERKLVSRTAERAGEPGTALERRETRISLREMTAPDALRRLREIPRPVSYEYGQGGKPFFRDYPWYFSLSHSGDYVLCALSEREIGADIQICQPADALKLAGRFFAGQEYEALRECAEEAERQRLFYELWVKKEALGKLTGRGVASVLRESMLQAPARLMAGQERSKALEAGGERADRRDCLRWPETPTPEGYAAAVCLEEKEDTGVERWVD